MTKNTKKGSTLLELTIVMAVIAMISVLIVSFCQIANSYTQSISKDEVVLTDMDKIKESFDLWTTCFDKDGIVIEIKDGKLQTSYNSKDYNYSFATLENEDFIIGTCLEENDILLNKKSILESTSTVESLSFDFLENEDNGLYILYVTVRYETFRKHSKNVLETKERVFMKTLRCAIVKKVTS